jgi:4-amino-4-deoxy-L-arabinose transferase-like glycosyltransferase
MQATARRIVPILLAVALVLQVGYALTNTQPPIWDETGHTRAAEALLNIHSLADVSAAVRASLRYGLIYPFWLASIYGVMGENFFFARLAQVLVSVATLALMSLAAREVYGKRAGIVTLAAGVLYLPFVATSARLLSETLAVFWLALALWLVARGLTRHDTRALFFAGAVTVLTGLTRPTLQALFVAVMLGVFAALWLSKQPLRRGLFFVAGVALVVVPFLLFTRVVIGRATLSGSVSPFEGIFVGNYVPDGGYPTDTRSFLHKYPQPEFDSVRAQDQAPKDIDFVRVTVQVAARDPLGFILLQARKLYDQWRAPFNDFEINFGLPYRLQEIFHALVISMGAVGALAFGRRKPYTFVFVAGWLYVIVTNLIVPVERRYAFPGIPFALILAGAVGGEWIAVIRNRTRLDTAMRLAILIVFVGALLLFGISAWTTDEGNKNETALSAGAKAEALFSLPDGFKEITNAELFIDAVNLETHHVRVTQNNQPLDARLRANRVFQNSTYATLLERRGIGPNQIRQWFRFQLDPGVLKPNAPLQVEIDGAPTLVRDTREAASTVVLPALDSQEPNSNTSLYKYLADNDYRIPRRIELTTNSNQPAPRYRILLVLTRTDGTQQILW